MIYAILIVFFLFINIDWFTLRFQIWPIARYGIIVKTIKIPLFEIDDFLKSTNYSGYNREFDFFKRNENEYYLYEEIGLIINRINFQYGFDEETELSAKAYIPQFHLNVFKHQDYYTVNYCLNYRALSFVLFFIGVASFFFFQFDNIIVILPFLFLFALITLSFIINGFVIQDKRVAEALEGMKKRIKQYPF